MAGWGAVCLALSFAMLASMNDWRVGAAACLFAGLGFYMLHNTLQTCATQLSTVARGAGVSMFACCLFFGQAAGVLLASIVVSRASLGWWCGPAAPMLGLIGLSFGSVLRDQLRVERVSA